MQNSIQKHKVVVLQINQLVQVPIMEFFHEMSLIIEFCNLYVFKLSNMDISHIYIECTFYIGRPIYTGH